MSLNFNRRVPSIRLSRLYESLTIVSLLRQGGGLSENKIPLDIYRLYSIFTALPARDVECIVSPDCEEAFFAQYLRWIWPPVWVILLSEGI
jgi:hypothetical protein